MKFITIYKFTKFCVQDCQYHAACSSHLIMQSMSLSKSSCAFSCPTETIWGKSMRVKFSLSSICATAYSISAFHSTGISTSPQVGQLSCIWVRGASIRYEDCQDRLMVAVCLVKFDSIFYITVSMLSSTPSHQWRTGIYQEVEFIEVAVNETQRRQSDQ